MPRTDRPGPDQAAQLVRVQPEALGLPAHPVSNVEDVTEALQSLSESRGCVLLAPTTRIDYLPPDHVIAFRVVTFDTSPPPSGWNQRFASNGTFYRTDSGKFALHKVAIDQLAQAAGLSWVPSECRRTDDGEPLRWEYRMTADMKGFDGKQRRITRTAEWDLREGSPHAIGMKPGQLAMARRYGAAHAESRAANRVVRAALGLGSYTLEESRLPFVFPVLMWVPPANDPEIRRMVAAKELGIVAEVFGAPRERVIVVDAEPSEALPEARALPDHGGATPDFEAQARVHDESRIRTETKTDPAPGAAAADPWDDDDPAPNCEECGEEVSPSVYGYSRRHFNGHVFCRIHQRR